MTFFFFEKKVLLCFVILQMILKDNGWALSYATAGFAGGWGS